MRRVCATRAKPHANANANVNVNVNVNANVTVTSPILARWWRHVVATLVDAVVLFAPTARSRSS